MCFRFFFRTLAVNSVSDLCVCVQVIVIRTAQALTCLITIGPSDHQPVVVTEVTIKTGMVKAAHIKSNVVQDF